MHVYEHHVDKIRIYDSSFSILEECNHEVGKWECTAHLHKHARWRHISERIYLGGKKRRTKEEIFEKLQISKIHTMTLRARTLNASSQKSKFGNTTPSGVRT